MENQPTVSAMMQETVAYLKTLPPSPSDTPEASGPFDVLGAMGRAGFPLRFRREEWKTPDFVKAYQAPMARTDFRDFRGLFLTGATGRKKTASLCLLARDWLTEVGRKGSKAWGFVTFPELCVELQEAWGEGGSGPLKIINRLAEVPILVVDDVGAEKTSEFVLQSAYLLFNKREQNELPTYGTSNLTLDEIKKKLDDRIASRIRGMCNIVEVGGEDQRGKKS
jgi:DNA replication protein DnaC